MCLGQFGTVEVDRRVGRERSETEHQTCRKRPRLAAAVLHFADIDPDFLANFPDDSGFRALTWFDETSQC